MVKQKRPIKYFVIFSFLLISLLPIYNFAQYAKKYDFSKLFNLDDVEKYVNYAVYKVFNRSLVEDKVITGKDGFLFLGNTHNDVLHKTNGTFRPSNKEINIWVDKLKNIQQWYENKGIKFLVVIAPNKHTIYREKLPNWMKYDGKTITDDIVEYAGNKNVNLLDLRNLFLEEKKKGLVYLKTDTHWNLKGASLAYDEIIRYLNINLSLGIELPKYSLKEKKRGGGDLANFLKINPILGSEYEKDYEYILSVDYNVCKGNIDKGNGQLTKCEQMKNPIVSINQQPQYVINHTIKNNKLLFICDSFASAPSQLYNATFNTVWKWHFSHINGRKLAKFVDENKPDVVIYQLVERSLYNDIIVAPLPKN